MENFSFFLFPAGVSPTADGDLKSTRGHQTFVRVTATAKSPKVDRDTCSGFLQKSLFSPRILKSSARSAISPIHFLNRGGRGRKKLFSLGYRGENPSQSSAIGSQTEKSYLWKKTGRKRVFDLKNTIYKGPKFFLIKIIFLFL